MSNYGLRDLPVGSMARIVAIRPTHRSYRSKLLSMGLTRGTPVRVQRIAPLGDPVLISVRGFELSLRKDEADALVLEPLEGDPEEHGFFTAGPAREHRGSGRGRGGRRAERGIGLGTGRHARGPRGRGRHGNRGAEHGGRHES
jgi:Fe2+ transport system protein FeoA